MLPSWSIATAVAVAAIAGAYLHGHRTGDEAARAELAAVADAQRESDRLRARAAATDYEARRAANARRAIQPSPESRYALTATICPPAGAFGRPLELGDVPIPGAVLDRLRHAGADY
jgi:hypothetical protein